jgi:hypothetical protein
MFEFLTELFDAIVQWFRSLTILEGILIVTIITVTCYFIYTNTGSTNNDVVTSMLELNKKTDIATGDVIEATLLRTNGSTVMGFFNLQQGNRTIGYNNDYVSLLSVPNNWSLEVSQTSTNKNVSARLRVMTNNSGTQQEEYIELPPIPRQKWICISILREGRRFDIIYDNRIVASQRLKYYPVIINNPMTVGNATIMGKVIHVIITPTRLSPSEVERQRRIYVNSNNDVLEANSLLMSLPSFKISAQCPPGLPCDNITHSPSNAYLKWQTPYA